MKKIIKYNNGSVDTISFESNDNYKINLGEQYKLVKFYDTKKTFKDTILGTDIGFNSQGFVNIAIISSIIAISLFAFLILSFRI